MLRPPLSVAHVPTKGGRNPHGVCLLRPIRTALAGLPATFASLATPLSHRSLLRVIVAAMALLAAFAVSQQATIQAGPRPNPVVPTSLLPQNIGVGISTNDAVTLSFADAMDRASVEEHLQLLPAQRFTLSWAEDNRSVSISAERRWRTDERYLLVLGGSASEADGTTLQQAARWSFTTQTAPGVTEFQVKVAGADLLAARAAQGDEKATRVLTLESGAAEPVVMNPTTTADRVSAVTSVSVGFSSRMDHGSVERRFAVSPEVDGTFAWEGDTVTFTPSGRLEPGMRYTVSLVGARDRLGNPVSGKTNFSFIVTPGAQLTRVSPGLGETDVEPESVVMWFSQPMDTAATDARFKLVDLASAEAPLAGELAWNAAGTQLTFTPAEAFAAGRTFEVRLGDGTQDQDGNPVSRTWRFSTKQPPPPPAAPATPQRSTTSERGTQPAPVSVPPPAPSSDLNVYALNQINAARAAYGFAPVTLDASISAVAYAHAYDQVVNGYFSHTSLDGRTREQRLRNGGVSFSWSGENQCYLVGRSLKATLDWCHAQFMAEPYPGHFNHIANILNPKAKRVGVGIATDGSRVVVTWNFTD